MNKLTPEILREAVELAEGWEIADSDRGYCEPPSWCFDIGIHELSKQHIAALASQLISQVNATGEYQVRVDKERTVILRSLTMVWHQFIEGPEPDHNSIIACVEFLRSEP